MPQNPVSENLSSSEELPARGDSVESYKEKAAKPAMSPKEMKAMEDKMKMVPHDPETTNSPDTGNFQYRDKLLSLGMKLQGVNKF